MIRVVILGGGFAGVSAGISLRKKLKKFPVKISIIDKNSYHLFTPSLYQASTSDISPKNITIPLKYIFNNGFDIVSGEIIKINTSENKIEIKNGDNIYYDYLIIALGSVPTYYAIPGLEENTITFKNLNDAIKIKERIKNACCKNGQCHKKTRVVIGGGGFAGTELAAELSSYEDKLALENGLDKNCLDITLIQGSDRLLKELDEKVSNLAEERLTAFGVHLVLGEHIKNVTETKALTDKNNEYSYDILIWAGGIKANSLASESNLPTNAQGYITVNKFLQAEGNPNIFACGDIAEFIDSKTKKPAPNVVQVAEEQGHAAGKNVARMILGQEEKEYKYRHFGYIIPLRGRYAAGEFFGKIQLYGLLAWILHQAAFLRYLFEILPFPKSIFIWRKFEQKLYK